MPTLKQRRLIRALKGSKSIKEAGEKAGYSYKARTIYRKPTKLHIESYLSKTDPQPEEIVREYIEALEECKRIEDMASRLHSLDSLARIKAMFIAKVENKIDANVTQAGQSLIDQLTHRTTRLDNDNSRWIDIESKPITMDNGKAIGEAKDITGA